MYSVKAFDIKAFITDGRIKLPRFQRKKTWTEVDNFKLCISLFKDYPMGVCIVSTESVNGRIIKFLLDGRQRREALTLLNNDPENLYRWAMRFIKFTKGDSDEVVTDKFYDVIGAFLEEESEEEHQSQDNDVLIEEDLPLLDDTDSVEEEEEEVDISLPSDGLELLLKLILKTHHWTKRGSGFTLPFDFSKYVTSLPYLDRGEGNNYTLSSRSLKSFISSYREFCKEKFDDLDAYRDMESFWAFIKRGSTLIQGKETKFKEHMTRHWGAMLERIELLQKLDEKLATNEIGVIEVNDMKSYDYQKIFNLINTQGSDLKAVEILSAKPKWNLKINNPTADFEVEARKLYRILGTSPEYYVKWDLPATFIDRLGNNFFFKDYSDSASDFEAKITAGFVVLSGIFTGAVNKEAFDKLGSDAAIDWNRDIDDLLNSIRTMTTIMSSFSYFQFFRTWKCNVQTLTSDYVAYNFFILCYKNWKSKNCPVGNDVAAKKFQKECFYLLDRLIFEYVSGIWKGSGDSRIKNNIDNLSANFVPVSVDDWNELLQEIFEQGKISGEDLKFGLMKPLLYHFYCLNCQRGPSNMSGLLDVDHIIPQALFNNSTFERKEVLRDNLLNLGILPKEENCSKGKKRLIEITDPWMKSEILEYEFVKEEDYVKFSAVENYQDLFNLRKPIFEKAYNEKRTNLIQN